MWVDTVFGHIIGHHARFGRDCIIFPNFLLKQLVEENRNAIKYYRMLYKCYIKVIDSKM